MKLDNMSKYDQTVLPFQWGNPLQDFTRITTLLVGISPVQIFLCSLTTMPLFRKAIY